MTVKNKKLSLSELMGKSGAEHSEHGMRLEHLSEILGEGMPDLPRTSVGRHRLIRALQQRFGVNFRSLPGVKELVHEFDEELEFEMKVAKMKAIRMRGK